jgi:hypothetical protein
LRKQGFGIHRSIVILASKPRRVSVLIHDRPAMPRSPARKYIPTPDRSAAGNDPLGETLSVIYQGPGHVEKHSNFAKKNRRSI